MSDNKGLRRQTYTKLNEWIDQLCTGSKLKVIYCNKSLPNNNNSSINTQPQPAIISLTIHDRKRSCRLCSSHEIRRTHYTRSFVQSTSNGFDHNSVTKIARVTNDDELHVGLGQQK